MIPIWQSGKLRNQGLDNWLKSMLLVELEFEPKQFAFGTFALKRSPILLLPLNRHP